jgi:hypothetical protein
MKEAESSMYSLSIKMVLCGATNKGGTRTQGRSIVSRVVLVVVAKEKNEASDDEIQKSASERRSDGRTKKKIPSIRVLFLAVPKSYR